MHHAPDRDLLRGARAPGAAAQKAGLRKHRRFFTWCLSLSSAPLHAPPIRKESLEMDMEDTTNNLKHVGPPWFPLGHGRTRDAVLGPDEQGVRPGPAGPQGVLKAIMDAGNSL